ncbi:short chain dehydrogenase/ reductase [Penicillium cf. griseofulvum]|uniref:Short chain dehydrogenase/ reductase n=1 Tax=Penicillium cf. griseofulvum TaxID=2972120 RepID=A0A9W9JND9_9EURO|nr:short chain dehydrogenase/ reductase [Penicillium cf. griseofulvum]KAJ5423781.1 short chain dehydrogenase/ reductase [Penicillium cf. griseofulvum]KAJ5430966.1 short chain dehydrogenase/ reductase [Penicillium cf. griseofulvum]
MFLFPRCLRDKLWTDALPPSGSFEGQTVLITGATSGLGLAASMHFVQLGAKLIITSRSLSAGDVAWERIEQSAGIVGQGKVQIMELDLSRYSSCVSFVGKLKQSQNCRMGIDVAVLNAEIIKVDYSQNPEGWYLPLQSMSPSVSFAGYSRRLLGSKPFKSTL